MATNPQPIECNSGWKKLYEPLIAACEATETEIHQIKEKFGGLRFYHGAAPQWLSDIVELTEAYSYSVCEMCGESGTLRTQRAWLRTLCDKCDGGPHGD